MTDTTYNGWTNYETWNCKLWMDNDEGSYHYFKEMAEQSNGETYELSQQLDAYFDDLAGEWAGDSACFFADIFSAALSNVNWYEIAEHLIDDVEVDA